MRTPDPKDTAPLPDSTTKPVSSFNGRRLHFLIVDKLLCRFFLDMISLYDVGLFGDIRNEVLLHQIGLPSHQTANCFW